MASTPPDRISQARDAFSRRTWEESYSLFSSAEREAPLPTEDVERLALAAFLTGRSGESAAAWTRAHSEHLSSRDWPRAARCAFRLSFELLNTGDKVRGIAWLTKARQVLDEHGCTDCVEQGYLVMLGAIGLLMRGDVAGAHAAFEQAVEIGRRFQDRDLTVTARHGVGRALIRLRQVEPGLALLDEAMVAVEAGDISPLFAGEIYCSVIEACFEVFDLRRAQEWTAALTQWCNAQPDLVMYSGQCMVRRAEILQLHGEWSEALDLARRACELYLKGPDQPAIGSAYYQQAELSRLLGDYARAEELYREASRRGKNPQPGLSLLKLGQGDLKSAAAAIRNALEAAALPSTRCRLLPAYVEIMLAAKDVEAARAGAEELDAIAKTLRTPLVRASATQARGAVLLASGDAAGAARALRESWAAWEEVQARYEGGRVRVMLGLACRELGDVTTAELELDAARWVFQQLSAGPDLRRLEAIAAPRAEKGTGGLTAREVEVLRLIATGLTNRVIGRKLSISEKTVARHVANIFTKLDLANRAAATAWAYQHGLAGESRSSAT